MPFTLRQLKSQDLRDINQFYFQNNIGKVNNTNAQTFQARCTLPPGNEADSPIHTYSKRRKKNNRHEADLDTDSVDIDRTLILNDANDLHVNNAACSTGVEEDNNIFKASTQLSEYAEFFSGVEEYNDMFRTSTQVSACAAAQNTENYNNELKIKKKHKKNRRQKENEVENLYENFHTKKEKNKTKPITVVDVELQGNNTKGEYVLQDSESSCATECSNKSKRKKKKQQHDNDVQTLESFNVTLINKPKKKKLQSISEDDSEKNNFHLATGADNSSVLMENTEKLDDFVMPKKLKLEEVNTFSTDLDLLDSVVDVKLQDSNTKGEYVLQDFESSWATEYSKKPKRKKKKQQYDNDVQTLECVNVTVINKPKKKKLQSISEDDSEKYHIHLATGADNSAVLMENTEKLDDFVMPKKLKLEEDNTFSTDSNLLDSYLCFSSKNNHSKKKKREKIESFPMPIVIKTENDLDEEEQSLRNAVQNSPIHSDHSISSTSKKHKKKRKDYSVEQDKNYSHEAKSLNKKHEKKYIQQVLEDMIKNMKDKDSEQIENSNNENSNQTKMQIENVREEEQRLSNIKNSTLIDSVKKKYSSKQLNTDVTSTVQENDESYLTFKNILLDSETPPQICDINDKLINLESDRKSKKHKKKSKDNRKIDKKCSEVLSAENEKSSAEDEQKNEKENVGDKANQLVSKREDITGGCKEEKFKRKHKKKSKVTMEDREMHSDMILEPLININMEESSSSDGPDDRFYIKKRNGRVDLCNIQDEKGIQTHLLNNGDETTSVDDIINEVLDNAAETSIHLVEEHQFLKDLVVHIPWEIPLAHTIETRMSSQPSAAQKEKFKEMNIPLKLGPYSKEEDKKILNNFEEFCKVHDIPHDSKPFLNFKHGRKMTLLNVKQRINFVQYLGKNLECRMLHSIYRRFVCLCTEKKKGRFTEEEDTIIQKYITNPQNKYDNKKFSTLAIILNRHRLAIEKRYKYLLSKEKLRKDNYKIRDHIPEYLKYLMEILKVNEVSQLKNMKITRDVWFKLADKIGQDQVKVKRIWETIIYPRLFAKNPIDRDQLMKQLILKLIKLKKTDYRDVNWCEMASEFENVTPAYLYQVFRILVANNVPERKRHDLSSTLKHLARAYRECDCIMKTQSKIEFENGQVSFIADP